MNEVIIDAQRSAIYLPTRFAVHTQIDRETRSNYWIGLDPLYAKINWFCVHTAMQTLVEMGVADDEQLSK